MAIKIVVDTNVFVSALTSATGASREVLRRCLKQECRAVIGLKLFLEMEDTLGRKMLFKNCPLTAGEREELFAAFASVCAWTKTYYLWRPNLRDEGDNHVLELAVVAGPGSSSPTTCGIFPEATCVFPTCEFCVPVNF